MLPGEGAITSKIYKTPKCITHTGERQADPKPMQTGSTNPMGKAPPAEQKTATGQHLGGAQNRKTVLDSKIKTRKHI
jgi:hypothetical protein